MCARERLSAGRASGQRPFAARSIECSTAEGAAAGAGEAVDGADWAHAVTGTSAAAMRAEIADARRLGIRAIRESSTRKASIARRHGGRSEDSAGWRGEGVTAVTLGASGDGFPRNSKLAVKKKGGGIRSGPGVLGQKRRGMPPLGRGQPFWKKSERNVGAQFDLPGAVKVAEPRSAEAAAGNGAVGVCPVGVVEGVQEFRLEAELKALVNRNQLGE